MKIRKYLCWLLVLALALSLPTAGLAAKTERINNADGSHIIVDTNDAGIVTSKGYYDKDGNYEAAEWFDGETGIIQQKIYYETIKIGDVTSSQPSRYDFYWNNGELRGYCILKYDENGKTMESHYDTLGNLTKTSMFTKADDKYITEHFDAEGNPDGKEVILLDEKGYEAGYEEYNAAGVLIIRQDYKTNTYEVFYDDGTQKYKDVYVENEDGSRTATEEDYNEKGIISQRRVETYTEDFDEGYQRTTISKTTTDFYSDGSISRIEEKTDGGTTTTDYYKSGVRCSEIVSNAEGREENYYDEQGNLTGTSLYDADDVLLKTTEYTTGADGKPHVSAVMEHSTEGGVNTTKTYSPDENGELQLESISVTTQEDGVDTTVVSTLNEEGEFVPTNGWAQMFGDDGEMINTTFVINEEGEPVITDVEKSYYDETGAYINESYSVDKDGNETLHHTTKNYPEEDGVWIHESYAVNEKGEQTLTSLHKTYDNPDGSSKEEIYLPNDQGELVLTETKYYDEDGTEIKKEEPVIIFSAPTWYPSNTASTAGFSFRKLRPELTDKWYNFTPVDLSKDGVQTIPLVAGNVYIVGKVEVAVNGDAVTVSYSMPGSKHDTARTESEFFTFFANLDAVTTVNPEEIGEGFKFGEPVSIEKDLGGDTKVLLFVRNVLSFRDYYTADKKLARYWPNSKNYNSYYQYLESIMD
ncbi:MAG: hypothetical protein ACOX6Y_05655 [Christensenellales bacterium]